MDVRRLKRGPELASLILRGKHPLATEKAITLFRYSNNQRTEEILGFATELVLPSQSYQRIRCVSPSMPRVFLGGDLQEAVEVELINPVGEVRYNNTLCLYADDIVLSSEDEVIDL